MSNDLSDCHDRDNRPVRPDDAGPSVGCLRAIDAAANRSREAIRVIEDFCRFVLDDRHLVERCKQMRHRLTQAMASVPDQVSAQMRLASRETQADVGTSLSTSAERRRDDPRAILAATCGRLQEGLRSLEEFGKLVGDDFAARFKRLRYESYTLERAVEITRGSLERLVEMRLYVLLDGRESIQEMADLARSLVEAGVDAIQLRDKRLSDRELIARARRLREICRAGGASPDGETARRTLCIINDRPDLAALAESDGVHVGQDELSVKDARAVVGPGRLVGVSTHSIEQARQAVLDGADYIGVGPTFPSGTKQFDAFPGPALLSQVASEIRLPAVAIGGIDQENLAEVIATGIGRVAVSGAITGADDPVAAARRMRAEIDEFRNGAG